MKTLTLASFRILTRLAVCLAGSAVLMPAVVNAQVRMILANENCFGPDGTGRAHVGDMLTSHISVVAFDDSYGYFDSISITSVREFAQFGKGSYASSNLLNEPYVFDYEDMYGEGLEITNCYRAFAGSGDYLLDSIEVKGTITFDGLGAAGPPLEFQSMGGNELRILQPALHLAMETKKAGPGELVTTFSGSVSNCGNTRLTNVVVFNYLNGVYDYLLGPVSLEAGGKINVALPSKAWSDGRSALLAWGTDELGLTVSNSVTPEPPISLGLIFSGQDMRLIWNSVIDRIYQVQYKTDWLQQDWKNLGGPIQAHGSFASLSDADKTIGQRFYRIVSLP